MVANCGNPTTSNCGNGKEKLLMSGNRVLAVLTLRAVGGGMEKFVTNNPPGATSYASIVPTAETEGKKIASKFLYFSRLFSVLFHSFAFILP
ncbi:hypothetical protein TNCT_573491 [Trichonephila clavata]|uniref:Uncharacterized protein n=1 Tax=Trichonephila clavata TaxID=2740835 RepID=A0A8X6LUN1_TRICU|nr:hypothetical protein TNCT_573491 [Trichonephila clavata]